MKTLFNTLNLMIFLMIIITGTANAKSDSLPLGVTRDWLNSLTDENGQKLMQPEEEGDALQEKFFTGFAASDQFGYSISSAGDVNNDGYSDLIVGAPFNDAGGSNSGRAYIYYGGHVINSVVDVVLTGLVAGDQFGLSVSTAGDVNGDGYSDIIVGAPFNDAGGSNSGRAYIFFGGSSMNNVADVILTGVAASDNFGVSVSTAGDVNGDGYSDVIAGATGNDAGGTSAGRAYIYFGGSSMNNVADVLLTAEAAFDAFGGSVANAGDVNGDGYGDLIVGAIGNDAGGGSAGRAYIYFGGSSMNSIADVILTGAAVLDNLGTSVSTAGDVNGDGYNDVIVGASGNDEGGTDAGRAYIYLGGSSLDNAADVIMTGVAGDFLGASVSIAGDVNGDGYSDVLAGAISNNSGGEDAGRAYAYFGGLTMDNTADIVLTGSTAFDAFGKSVSTAGDMNGDGYSDIIAGATGNDAGGSSAGRVYLYDYFMKNEIIPDLSMTGEATENYLGYSVSSAGDVNGDGYSDVIVGALGYSSRTGRAFIHFGGPSMDNTADVIMTGETTNNYFGGSVSSAGDINGDGYSDVIVGARGYSTFTGRAYIYFGGASMNNTADVTMTGDTTNNNFGSSVSSAGDVNGDGYSDVIVGADGYSSNTGRANIYFGGASMNNTADVIMTGEATFNYFGYSVSSAGDINGDGYSDVITGAYGYSSYTGRSYVFFGGAAMNSVADVTINGESAGDNLGNSVSSAGDVNADGFSDVVVGASDYSAQTGRAYVFFGGSFMNNVADVIFTGDMEGYNLGVSATSAGDVNDDGFSDVLIGASGYSTSTGRAYIHFGGLTMDNTPDVTMTGEATIDQFGASVSSAGDFNGDGYSDVIVGALGYSGYTGRAYMYLGSAISAKPILNYVKDVPNDQGGFVDLKWARSSYDVIGSDIITHYIVERSAPPIGGNFAWVNVAQIPSNKNAFYSYLAATPYDSSSNSNGSFFFRITARTSVPSQYWRSAILSGRSTDNIAPLMVSPFTAAPVVNNVLLNWNRSTSPDLLNYVLYRSTSPTIDPGTEPVFATTTDSAYLDTVPLSGVYYYFIVAQDIHNNKSPVAVAESPNMTLNLTVFIEGFYNAGSNSQVSDTIQVELRNSTTPFAVADQSKAVVSSNGTVQLKFGNASNGSYYIAVKHRSSIETWSAGTIALSRTTPASYDISASASQAFGSNMIQVDTSPVRFAIFGGDVNQDGTVDATDVSMIDNDAQNFVGGYVVTDLTGDDFVDGTDFAIADNNAGNFVSVVRP
ncbi:MAG: FG-GAP-like repeat-containing protein [Ignavibacteria bacterium]|nr:FG-GAP-like repeat-containing protein [Ignavibacteria bacterium]